MCQDLVVINQQLWCCFGGAGIVVFNNELPHQRTVASSGVTGIVVRCGLIEISNGDAVMATKNGLYL